MCAEQNISALPQICPRQGQTETCVREKHLQKWMYFKHWRAACSKEYVWNKRIRVEVDQRYHGNRPNSRSNSNNKQAASHIHTHPHYTMRLIFLAQINGCMCIQKGKGNCVGNLVKCLRFFLTLFGSDLIINESVESHSETCRNWSKNKVTLRKNFWNRKEEFQYSLIELKVLHCLIWRPTVFRIHHTIVHQNKLQTPSTSKQMDYRQWGQINREDAPIIWWRCSAMIEQDLPLRVGHIWF